MSVDEVIEFCADLGWSLEELRDWLCEEPENEETLQSIAQLLK